VASNGTSPSKAEPIKGSRSAALIGVIVGTSTIPVKTATVSPYR
jgi:hypothetical protein